MSGYLKSLMAAVSLSQGQLCRETGLSKGTVSQIVNLARYPKGQHRMIYQHLLTILEERGAPARHIATALAGHKPAEAEAAINKVKDIYVSRGDPKAAEDALKLYGASIPQGELDSLTYNNAMMEKDCKKVVADFEKYIQKFPDGFFILQANFYKAECDYKLGNSDASLTGYQFVIGKNKNEFAEQSLYRASDMVYKKQNYILQ